MTCLDTSYQVIPDRSCSECGFTCTILCKTKWLENPYLDWYPPHDAHVQDYLDCQAIIFLGYGTENE